MYSWTFSVGLLLAMVLFSIRLYLARTSYWLDVHLSKVNSLKPAVDDALQIVLEESPLVSEQRLIAGFALSEARWELMEAFRWIAASRGDIDARRRAPRPGRFKGDLYAWLILLESRDRFLIALKYARPLDLDARALKKLSKLRESEDFHKLQATEFIDRLHRKQGNL